jgi:hypothetical protein
MPNANPAMDLIEKKYPLPYWSFIREFRNDTGFNANRFADALAVGLYGSRGQHIVGFELKISRADWLRELKQPEKAEAIARFCDYWNVVITDEQIVDLAEFPPNWGLLLASGKRVKVLKPAPALTAQPMPRDFMAAIVKQAIDRAIAPYLVSKEEKNRQAENEGFERGRKLNAHELGRADELRKAVHEFENAAGIRIATWEAKNIGAAVKAVLEGDRTITRAHSNVVSTINQMEDVLAKLKLYRASLEPANADVAGGA